MKRVLVTGASGFIGRHALPALKSRGFDVHAVARRAPAQTISGVSWHAADLLEPREAERVVNASRPTHLLHLAWFVRPGAYWRAPENVEWVEASLRLVRAFAEQGGRRAVFAGTSAEYDWRSGAERFSEHESPTNPATLYGAAKHALRLVVEAYAREVGLSTAWGRLFFVYGPHESPGRLTSSIARALLRGEPAACSDGAQVRDFLHVADAADAFAALLDSSVEGPVNVASGEATAVKEVIATIAEAAGRPDLVRWGAGRSAVDEPPVLEADVTRLSREVEWRPRFSLRAGVQDAVVWWKAQLRACPVCAASDTEEFLCRDGVPAHQNLVMPTREAAIAAERGNLRLSCCGACGFVYNRAFEPSRLSYGPSYDNRQTCSASFRDHIDELLRHLVEERGVRGARIVEVGCGQGSFLEELVAAAGDDATGIGFDPSYTGPETTLGGRVRFERRFYGPDCADVPADVVVCRHVIEHVPDPIGLLTAVRQALAMSDRARVYFETPTVEWILRNHVVWDFFYEHCSYFSAASLSAAFQIAGFEVDQVRHVFGGQYLWLEARPAVGEKAICKDAGEVPALARRFGEMEAETRAALAAQLAEWAGEGEGEGEGGVALWGAGAKGATLCHLVDPDRRLIRCVVDLNPHKQGRFIPGTGHPIVGYDRLVQLGVRTAVLMNANYRAENERLLREAGIDVVLTDLLEPMHASGD